MSIARKRAKVKKKSQAARGAKKKRATKKKARKVSKKRGAKSQLSVNTKVKRRPASVPKKKILKRNSKKVVARPKKRKVSVSTKTRTPPKRPKPPLKKKKRKKKKIVRKPKTLLQQIAERFEVPERVVTLTAFLQQPQIADQIRDRIIEKGLAELRTGLVQTKESIIIGHLIIAEQLGNFDQRARELAVEFNMPLRDVYELWNSPKLGEAAE